MTVNEVLQRLQAGYTKVEVTSQVDDEASLWFTYGSVEVKATIKKVSGFELFDVVDVEVFDTPEDGIRHMVVASITKEHVLTTPTGLNDAIVKMAQAEVDWQGLY